MRHGRGRVGSLLNDKASWGLSYSTSRHEQTVQFTIREPEEKVNRRRTHSLLENTYIQYNPLVLPSLTQFREIGSVYPEFAIIIAIGLRNPMLNGNQAQILYMYNVY